MQTYRAAALRALALTLALLAGKAAAHEGHDHDAPPASIVKGITPRGEAASAAFEIVAVAREGRLTLYLDRFASGEPVTDAVVALATPGGSQTAEPTDQGSYAMPAPWLAEPGHHELVVTVSLGGKAERFEIDLDIPETAAAPAAAPPTVLNGLRERLAHPDPARILAAAGGFLLGLSVMLLRRARRRVPAIAVLALTATLMLSVGALAHGDDDHDDDPPPTRAALTAPAAVDLAQRLPDGAVFVPKPTQRLLDLRTFVTEAGSYRRTAGLPARVIPDPNASGVVQSSVGGRLSPPASGLFPRLGTPVRKGDVLAFVTPPVQRVDVSDMRQRQGELDQQIAIVQRRVDRFRRLAGTGAVAQVQFDEAQDELKGLLDRRAALDAIRFDPEPLIAPVNGVIAEAGAVAGQMAGAGQMIFRIVDPKRLWVEALSFEALSTDGHASARLPDGRSFALVYQGSGLADRNQAVPVQFALPGDASALRIGQFLTVLAGLEGERAGLALPRAAIVRAGNGQDVVYEHVAAERYAARPVRVEPLDGERVLIAGGLEAGRRVVVRGAELLDQVR